MALQLPTLNGFLLAAEHEDRLSEARRNVDDYLQALNLPEHPRTQIADRVLAKVSESQPVDPVKSAMEELFMDTRVKRILNHSVSPAPVQPEVKFTSMLPQRMEFYPIPGWVVAARIAVCVGFIAGLLALFTFLG